MAFKGPMFELLRHMRLLRLRETLSEWAGFRLILCSIRIQYTKEQLKNCVGYFK